MVQDPMIKNILQRIDRHVENTRQIFKRMYADGVDDQVFLLRDGGVADHVAHWRRCKRNPPVFAKIARMLEASAREFDRAARHLAEKINDGCYSAGLGTKYLMDAIRLIMKG